MDGPYFCVLVPFRRSCPGAAGARFFFGSFFLSRTIKKESPVGVVVVVAVVAVVVVGGCV